MQSYQYDTATTSIKGKDPATASWSASSQPFPYQRRRPLSQSTFIRPQAALATSRSLGTLEAHIGRRSTTWSSSTRDHELLAERDEVDDRAEFVEEYNRLAKRYGIRSFVPGDFPCDNSIPTRKGSWFSQALRRTSSGQSTQTGITIKPGQQQLRRRRSISDVALNLVHHSKKDGLENLNLQDLVRLCGKSLFYLPAEYTPYSLVLPTCFRALAQALVQQADTRGIFRIPGSVRIVNMLYNYYCADRGEDDISTTTRCPNLPLHIKCSPHDVASAFKRFLAGLPSGILGSLSLFDALVAIHSQLHADPGLTKTKETKLRARLIALAIGTVKSQYQRELICAVFGLLCFVGRAAENAPREDEEGRPLPTSDLMGYNALGIIFGPLLVNDLIDSYKMRVADPASGLVLLPISPPKSRKESRKGRRKHKKCRSSADGVPSLPEMDKIHVANCIAEMLIVHWREVVRQMRNLGTLKIRRSEVDTQHRTNRARPTSSHSDIFSLRKPPDWDEPRLSYQQKDRDISPGATTPTPMSRNGLFKVASEDQLGSICLRRRSRHSNSSSSHKSQTGVLGKCLSPTVEESPSVKEYVPEREKTSRLGYSSILRDGSPSDQVISGSEMTFHTVTSSMHENGGNEGYFTQNGHTLATAKPTSLVKSPLSPREPTNYQARGYPDIQGQGASPAEKWKTLTLASKASMESLAKDAKERRLRRSPHNGSWRQSEESLLKQITKPSTPERTWQLTNKRNEEVSKPARLSPEKRSIFENSLQSVRSNKTLSPQKPWTLSPVKSDFDGGRPVSQRSSSKPAPGSVKAMAALFDDAARGSRASSPAILAGRTDQGSKGLSNFLSPYSRSNSPSKSTRSNASPATSTASRIFDTPNDELHSIETPMRHRQSASSVTHKFGPTYSQGTPKNTPTKFPPVALRPTGNQFLASRKVPQVSPAKQVPQRDRELNQPPSLGTMVSPLEEPPVAQHITFNRPSPTPSPIGHDGSDDERASTQSPRPGSSNSVLHYQIRHLQRQLEQKMEENTQLRRQLEARENMDIGKVLEQLRGAKRECKIWRERAEAAEKRVKVFKQFTARVRGLRDSVALAENRRDFSGDGQVDGPSHRDVEHSALDGDGSSSNSEHTENQEELKDRIRQSMKMQSATRSYRGVCLEGSVVRKRDGGLVGKKGLWEKNIPTSRTAQLWDIAEDMLMIEGEEECED
ncbi:hypothetical protein F5Y05DRAFT_425067 [Hypoxylon sp. FL0543]|nr:hypothetical protein F5Y05DRAFT_425067 [Hypoxylon sp. FL0543]